MEDALYNLRLSITENTIPILSTSADPTPADTVTELSLASHVSFNVNGAHRTFALTAPTRFAPDSKPIDLRSCYFAWQNKDSSVTDYFAAVQGINEDLPAGAGGSVQNLTFAQKIELIAWLSGETESSDSIAAIESGAATAAGDAAAIAGGKGVPVDRDLKRTGGGKIVDARLLQIYDGERSMGDHNTILRGTKNIVSFCFTALVGVGWLHCALCLLQYELQATCANILPRTSPSTAKSPKASCVAGPRTSPRPHHPSKQPSSQIYKSARPRDSSPSFCSPHRPPRSSAPETSNSFSTTECSHPQTRPQVRRTWCAYNASCLQSAAHRSHSSSWTAAQTSSQHIGRAS
jgi:hypothetical protein